MADEIIQYEFIHKGGQTLTERGKVHWPHQLVLRIDRREALRIIAQLANRLDYPDEGEPIQLWFSGKLAQLEEG